MAPIVLPGDPIPIDEGNDVTIRLGPGLQLYQESAPIAVKAGMIQSTGGQSPITKLWVENIQKRVSNHVEAF